MWEGVRYSSNGYRVSFRVDETKSGTWGWLYSLVNILTSLTLCFKWMNFMVCELYLNKGVFKKDLINEFTVKIPELPLISCFPFSILQLSKSS